MAADHLRSSTHFLGSATSDSTSQSQYTVAWKKCNYCNQGDSSFRSPKAFCQHLRDFHSTKEGGSYICHYGPNNVCPSLPVEGVSDRDYEDHVARDHVPSVHSSTRMSTSTSGDVKSDGPHHSVSTNPTCHASEPSVVQDQYKWTIFQSKVNLPAALNDPRLARRETDFFSKTWGEGFEHKQVYPSPHLPVIEREDFKKYLKRTSKRYEQHIQGQTDIPLQPASSEETIPIITPRQQEKQRAELDSIPKIFLQPGFSLENPDTFNAVFPWTQIEQGKQDAAKGAKRQSSKLLQEKLSHCLDVVEVQIAKQISLRSEAFFHAMTSHDALQEHMKSTCARITALRKKMQDLDTDLVKDPLTIIKYARTRKNHIQVKEKLALMATVHQTQPTIQLLLSTNEFVGALDLIATTQEVLSQELQGIVCFRHLGSQLAELEKLIDKMMAEDFVRYTNEDLNRELEDGEPLMDQQDFVITDRQEKLVSIVLGMLRQKKLHFIEVYKEEVATTLKAIVKQTVIEVVSEADNIDIESENAGSLADQMRLLNYKQWMALLRLVFDNLLVILTRVKGMTRAIEHMLQVAISNTSSSHHQPQPLSSVTSQASDVIFDAQQQSQQQQQATDYDDIETMLENGTTVGSGSGSGSSPTVNGAGLRETGNNHQQHKRVGSNPPAGPSTNGEKKENGGGTESGDDIDAVLPTEITFEAVVGGGDQLLSHGECLKVSAMLREMLYAVCNHAHDRCVKILVARAKDGFLEKLSTHEFVQLSRAIEGFVASCAALCGGRKSTSLRTCLQSQANRFVTRFHEERKNKLSLILDNERWKQTDVPPEFQELVDHISSTGQLSIPKRKFNLESKPQESLMLGDEKYVVVGTVLMLLKMMVEYCQCVDDLPTATPDILTRLIELLKLFNSRTCQLILGAGAVQLVGLKNISTKNLVLASRCLQLVIVYIDQVKEHFRQRLPEKQHTMLKHFDALNKDYSDHVKELSCKLVSIMDAMFDATLAKWEVKAPMPSVCFRNICKQISRLHEGISGVLPEPQVLALFQRVHNSFKVYLRGQLIRLGVCNDGGPQHGLVVSDVSFYLNSIKSLPGLSSLNDNMDAIWDKT